MKEPKTKTPHEPTADWLRLEQVVKSCHMSVNSFALHIGLPRSENLYQIKKGNHGISKLLAERINEHFPEFSVSWLLTGEGKTRYRQMLDSMEINGDTIKRVPVYNRIQNGSKPLYYVHISEELINGSDLAVISKDESLVPKIPVGAMVFLKPAQTMIAGKYYLIETEDISLIRQVVLIEPDNIKLKTVANPQYADIEVNRSHIVNFYTVEKIHTE